MKTTLPLLLFFIALLPLHGTSQNKTLPPKVLVVVAHPDDETAMAATIYKITHELHGTVDQAVVTNGEAGYHYSLLSEEIYHKKLTDEATGRKSLPAIRKKELRNAGKIIGVRQHYFLDQKDRHYGLDEREPLDSTWNVPFVEKELGRIMKKNNYDYVFCLIPDSLTHAGHKAASILALKAALAQEHKPIVLGVSVSNKDDKAKVYTELNRFGQTKVSSAKPSFSVDRTRGFGYKNKLNYKVIVNWEIAEHKSQGTMQLYMGYGDFENFWFFDSNDPAQFSKAENLFNTLATTLPNTTE